MVPFHKNKPRRICYGGPDADVAEVFALSTPVQPIARYAASDPLPSATEDLVHMLVGGLRQGMGYCGTPTIEALRTETRFVRISGASHAESHPHDIEITKEAPNYRTDLLG